MPKTKSRKKKGTYQEYLAAKHRRLKAPRQIIDRAIKDATGSLPKEMHRLVVGEVNEVYDIKTEDKESVVIRISRRGLRRFTAEHWALEQCRRRGIPVPKVLLLKSYKTPREVLAICIEQKIPGQSLNDILSDKNRNSSRIRKLCYSAGRELAKIHSIKVIAYGGLNTRGRGHYTSWASYVVKRGKSLESMIRSATNNGIKKNLVNKAVGTLKQHAKLFRNVRSRLIHGDYSLQHVLVQGNKVTGIIDFENCTGGDPIYDIARWDYYYGNEIPLSYLTNGYSPRKLGKEFQLKLHLYRLYLSLSLMPYYEKEKNASGVDLVRTKFHEDMDFFDGE